MVLLAEMPSLGYLEGVLHSYLEQYRCNDGSGREWFRISVDKAFIAVGEVMRADEDYERREEESRIADDGLSAYYAYEKKRAEEEQDRPWNYTGTRR